MHDIKILEEKWIQYKKNRRKPYYIFVLLSILSIGIVYYILILKNGIPSERIKKVEPINTITRIKLDKPLIDGSISTLALELNPIKKSVSKIILNRKELIPTLPVVNNIPVIDTVRMEQKPINNIVEKNKIQKQKVKRNISIKKPHKKMHLEITKSSSTRAYKEVEKRFNQFQDPDDSLFLAKSYYAKKEYKKSEYWALRTNKLDKNIEESWIIFVKSKIKLGYTKDAIHILSNYVRQSDSQEAKNLLYKLKK